ncbi:MAG: hypothetical protein GXP62_04165 [Oligoflexia bacterium]|nr:hypothetical protein [Oligoflexia bacterium]
MLSRILNLPLRALGRAARVVERAEVQRQSLAGDPPSARSSASLRVGSPMDVPDDFKLGPLKATAARILADRDAGIPVALVDVRTTTQHRRARPTGALHMPGEQVVSRIAEIPAQGRIVVIGARSDPHARDVASFLRYRGLEDTWLLDGGFAAWQTAGGPVTQG